MVASLRRFAKPPVCDDPANDNARADLEPQYNLLSYATIIETPWLVRTIGFWNSMFVIGRVLTSTASG